MLFGSLTFNKNWNEFLFEILDQFSLSSLEIRKFSHFNQIFQTYLSCLHRLTNFRFNVNSNTIMKRQINLTKFG